MRTRQEKVHFKTKAERIAELESLEHLARLLHDTDTIILMWFLDKGRMCRSTVYGLIGKDPEMLLALHRLRVRNVILYFRDNGKHRYELSPVGLELAQRVREYQTRSNKNKLHITTETAHAGIT
jgi:hypothetical protein